MLGVLMFVNLAIQVLWIPYAPITGLVAEFYQVTDLQIGLLSMVFMIAFIPSWLLAQGLLNVSAGQATRMEEVRAGENS